MQEYLVTLKPLSPFFFGTNKTFSDKDLHNVTSSRYPQQTHILGMLRNYLLKHSGNLKLRKRGWWVENKDFLSAFNLVGGFDKNSNQQVESFGIIQNISTVFLVSKQNKSVKDFHFEVPKDSGYTIKLSNSTVFLAGILKSKSYFLEGFSAKDGLLSGLTTQKFWKQYKENGFSSKAEAQENILQHEKIFQAVKQVGIRRDSKTKTVYENDEGSFYNKTSFTFQPQEDGTLFEFGFVLSLKETDKLKLETALVELGAERSLFEMSFTKYDDRLKTLYPVSNKNFKKAVVLGECFVNNFENIEFMVSDSFLPHAYLIRSNKKVFHANSNKSKQQNLIPKGSVIVLSKEFKTSNNENTKIGYNQLIYI